MDGSQLVDKLQWNTEYFRKHMNEAGFVLSVSRISFLVHFLLPSLISFLCMLIETVMMTHS